MRSARGSALLTAVLVSTSVTVTMGQSPTPSAPVDQVPVQAGDIVIVDWGDGETSDLVVVREGIRPFSLMPVGTHASAVPMVGRAGLVMTDSTRAGSRLHVRDGQAAESMVEIPSRTDTTIPLGYAHHGATVSDAVVVGTTVLGPDKAVYAATLLSLEDPARQTTIPIGDCRNGYPVVGEPVFVVCPADMAIEVIADGRSTRLSLGGRPTAARRLDDGRLLLAVDRLGQSRLMWLRLEDDALVPDGPQYPTGSTDVSVLPGLIHLLDDDAYLLRVGRSNAGPETTMVAVGPLDGSAPPRVVELPRPALTVVPGDRPGEILLLSAGTPQVTAFGLLDRDTRSLDLPALVQPAEVLVVQ